jgi:Aspartyl protease
MKRKFFYVSVSCLLMASCGRFVYSQNKPEPVEVPFRFERSSVLVQVKVNGKGPYNMLLDTGAEQSAIDVNTAKELELKLTPIGGGKAVATGKKENTLLLTKLPQIEIGNLTAAELLTVATDFSRISQRIGVSIHGVIGYNFLKNRVVQFDYPKSTVRFYSASPFVQTAEYRKSNGAALPLLCR